MKTPTVQYGSAASTSTNTKTPVRGYGGNESNGYVDPGWKNAVDFANNNFLQLCFLVSTV